MDKLIEVHSAIQVAIDALNLATQHLIAISADNVVKNETLIQKNYLMANRSDDLIHRLKIQELTNLKSVKVMVEEWIENEL